LKNSDDFTNYDGSVAAMISEANNTAPVNKPDSRKIRKPERKEKKVEFN
jgi:hypothetical protein